ncbi:HepT-like ribonuclease domain-containing protein [Imperialibacter sp.]|uniref:HepT-like ribonuclease domain-containing protein n=1 Tax=Imperialibacter sp. TaxID=2038411 RepID=UPI0032EF0C9A
MLSTAFWPTQRQSTLAFNQYTIIGEATASIDSSVLEKYDYPWYKVKSFRNFILHEYHAVEMRVIWDTTTEILPGLKEMMEEILTKEF